MKRGLLCILFVVLLTVNVSAIVVSESTPVVLINEDFSKFVEGSETAPAEQDLADESTGAIDAQYTQQAGWSGMGIFQAGGICAIAPVYNYYFYEGGYLNTPKGDYSGVITYSFRARLQEGDQSKINVVMGEGYNTIDSYAHTLTTDWQTYTGEFKKGTFDRCFIQFSAGDEDKVLIDDIKIVRIKEIIPTPKSLEATDLTREGFTAHWESSERAKNYLLSVYSKRFPDGKAPKTEEETFDTVNCTDSLISSDNPQYPEGWVVDVVTHGTRHVYTDEGNYNSASVALAFDATGDSIVTPLEDDPMDSFSFWGKTMLSGNSSKIHAEYFNGVEWKDLGYSFASSLQTGRYIDLTSSLPSDCYRVKIWFEQKNNGRVAIDDISYSCMPVRENVYVFEDKNVGSVTSYNVEGLDENLDYYYYVKASSENGVQSEPSDEIAVIGLVAPVVAAATDVTESSYTAHWEKTPKAEGYRVNNYSVYTAREDEEYVVLEEDFSKVTTSATPENPDEFESSSLVILDEYTLLPNWLFSGGLRLANGMLGGYGWQATLQTPELVLNNDTVFEVTVTAWAKVSSGWTDLYIYSENDTKTLTFEKSESKTFTVEMKNGIEKDCLRFATDGGTLFFIDNIVVKQKLKAGAQVSRLENSVIVRDSETTSYSFTGLQCGQYKYGYEVSAYRLLGDDLVESEFSDRQIVEYIPSGVNSLSASGAKVYAIDGKLYVQAEVPSKIEIYSISGMSVLEDSVGVGENQYDLLPGFYIVKVGNRTTKVLVK